MSDESTIGGPCENTDRELWRERPDDYYADSIHVTTSGGIGINCGGYVVVMPLRAWHALACPGRASAAPLEMGAIADLAAQVERVQTNWSATLSQTTSNGDNGPDDYETLSHAVAALKAVANRPAVRREGSRMGFNESYRDGHAILVDGAHKPTTWPTSPHVTLAPMPTRPTAITGIRFQTPGLIRKPISAIAGLVSSVGKRCNWTNPDKSILLG